MRNLKTIVAFLYAVIDLVILAAAFFPAYYLYYTSRGDYPPTESNLHMLLYAFWGGVRDAPLCWLATLFHGPRNFTVEGSEAGDSCVCNVHAVRSVTPLSTQDSNVLALGVYF